VDSRTILDCNGAERLIGSGDMLYLPLEASRPVRVQGAFVSTREVEAVVAFLRQQGEPEFAIEPPPQDEEEQEESAAADEAVDEFLQPALEFVRSRKFISVSLLQRKLRIGYNRAARLIEIMEERGIVGPADGSKPREVLLSTADDFARDYDGSDEEAEE